MVDTMASVHIISWMLEQELLIGGADHCSRDRVENWKEELTVKGIQPLLNQASECKESSCCNVSIVPTGHVRISTAH